MKRDVFGTYNPIINFIYFAGVIIFGVVFLHPVMVGISLGGALIYAVLLRGKKALKFFAFMPLIIMVLTAVINPLFVHRGTTVIFYLGANPVTEEALIYGIVSGVMIAAVIMWFYCYGVVMTSDKFMYVFGRLAPSSSLVFSMVLRFIPRFSQQAGKIADAQKCIRKNFTSGTSKEQIGHGVKITSIMTTWALENAIETADSMRSRGYGLPGRSTYSNFRFEKRDTAMMLIMAVLFAAVIAGFVSGAATFECYPVMEVSLNGVMTYMVSAVYFIICAGPAILDLAEEIRWKHSISKI